MILLPCPVRGWSITHDLKKVLWKRTNAAGLAWCDLGEKAPRPCPTLATTLLQILQSFLPSSAVGMGPLPLRHMMSTSVPGQLFLLDTCQ